MKRRLTYFKTELDSKNFSNYIKTQTMNRLKIMIFSAIMMTLLFSCSKDPVIIDDLDFEATDWTTETHSKDVEPNFNEIFDDNQILMKFLMIMQSNVLILLYQKIIGM